MKKGTKGAAFEKQLAGAELPWKPRSAKAKKAAGTKELVRLAAIGFINAACDMGPDAVDEARRFMADFVKVADVWAAQGKRRGALSRGKAVRS